MTSSEFLSASASTPNGGDKRKRGRPSKSGRVRKRQKRLDAIRDPPVTAPAPGILPRSPIGDEPASLRRSNRARRAPAVLDSSPTPSFRRRNKHMFDDSSILSADGSRRKGRKKKQGRRRKGDEDHREEEKAQASGVNESSLGPPAGETKSSEEDTEDWKSRLRSRVGKGNPWRLFAGGESLDSATKTTRKQREEGKSSMSTLASGSNSRILGSKKRGKMTSADVVSKPVGEVRDQDAISPLNYEEDGGEEISKNKENEFGPTSQVVCESHAFYDSQIDVEEDKNLAIPTESVEFEEIKEEAEHIDVEEEKWHDQTIEEGIAIPNQQTDNIFCTSPAASPLNDHPNSNNAGSMEIVKEDYINPDMSIDKIRTKQVKEGRRCGLCGGGTDGKPPKRLVPDFSGSDKETFEGSSASEEHNYDIWDGFGDEPSWLGRLLGPIRDRFGIARVWVHQHCAVWSPEVYFAGLGCLKNVRAALYRGRALKCSRCGRPGATIGCRVDRCPKTYHLPCSRAEGCIFDHRKFLIACHDHRRLFQPQGNDYTRAIKKLKVKKLKLEVRKNSHEAWRKDVEAEEKWLENCGEDEEFLKREGKRLHRDLLRIAPVYIGGSSECQNQYQGWESVAGLQDVINCMKEVVILPLLYPELFEALSLTPPRGILLHGHPGTGKTLVVRALIGACSRGDKRIAYFARKGADCLGKYVGDAERQLRLLFQVAERSQPSIIFFDEIDGLAPCRSRHSDQTHNSVVSTLLSLLDGLKSRGSVIVIGATNRPDAIDPALRRPGRFDREIYFPLPSMKDRASIVSLHTKDWPSPVSGSILSWIANQTSGYAGADLQALCTQAAMNALKRNCPLQEILTSAEKLSGKGRLPSLPSFTIEEKDWIAALSVAPPPCSRRASGMAANDVVSAPLFSHLVPSLLKPLSKLLISLYIDERIWLSPALIKASKSIKDAIIFALEQEKLPVGSWLFKVDSLIQQPYVAKEIIKSLSQYGLVSAQRGYHQSLLLNNDMGDLEGYDLLRSKSSNSSIANKLNQASAKFVTSSGFRVLIAGKPRSGQHHLGSCLIHGFKDHIDIQKINLATILQEGNGDMIRGLTHILLKCMSSQKCVIYMPRMDLWAIDEINGKDAKHNEISSNIVALSPASVDDDIRRVTSEAWNLFLEQVNSVSAASSVIILATCELEIYDIPDGIKQFFTDDLSDTNHSVCLEKSVPRFLVNLDGNFDPEIMISSFAAKLAEDLVQEYFQLVYHTTHADICDDKGKTFHAREARMDGQESEEQNLLANMATDSEHYRAPCSVSQNEDSVQRFSTSTNIGVCDADTQCHDHQDSVSRIPQSRLTKGGSALAIATFGYQILRLPQFAELCWVSSKLREGPSTYTNGPWKGWPFNSCIISTSPSLEKVVPGVNNGRVRGLVAVGLLAYRGIYTSVREVSSEVRKVLELLVGQIRAKILGGKDRYCYHRILSQVAYLEDIVCSWAYTFKSLPGETRKSLPSAISIMSGETPVNNDLDASCLVGNNTNRPTIETGCSKLDNVNFESSPHKFVTGDGDSANLCTETAGHTSSTSDVLLMTKEPSQSFLTSIYPSSAGATRSPPSRDGSHGLENMLEQKDRFSGLEEVEKIPHIVEVSNHDTSVTETNFCSEVAQHGNQLQNVGSITDEQVTNIDSVCLYNCCFGCLSAVYLSIRNILSETLRSTGSCSKVDDVHELFTSCSLNLTNAIRNCCISPSSSWQEEHSGKENGSLVPIQKCACKGFTDERFKREAAYSSLEEVTFLPTACNCHLGNMEDIDMENSKFNPSLQSLPSFFFRNGVLMPLNPQLHSVFHCNNENLCVCSILRMISSNK